MRRHLRWMLLSIVATACGGPDPGQAPHASPGSPSPPGSSSAPPRVVVRSGGPATIVNEWTSVTGGVTVETVDGTPTLVVWAPWDKGHFVASACFTFKDPSAPSVGTYTAADAGPGTIFKNSGMGGDIDWWRPGVGGSGGQVVLTIDEATSTSVHGRLHVDLKFSVFDATF
jgi:hypothetical protein